MTGLTATWRDDARAENVWAGVRVCVAGLGLSGAVVQRVLDERGAEVTVVIRFWIIPGVSVAAGLGVFYAEWVAGAGS